MQAKHVKRRRRVLRKVDIAIFTIAILLTCSFSYSIIANAAFPKPWSKDDVEVTEAGETSENEVEDLPQVIETYDDLANDPEVLAKIAEAQAAGEELIGTAATIVAQQQEEAIQDELEETNSWQSTEGENWDLLVKSTGNKQLWNDYVLLCRDTQAEAGNQTMVQRMEVAATILNRVGTNGFKDTIAGVIFQEGQFATAKNGEIVDSYGKVINFSDVTAETKEAVYRALINGEDPTEEKLLAECNNLNLDPEKYAEGGALYFYPYYLSGKEATARKDIKCQVQDGTHIFYKFWD